MAGGIVTEREYDVLMDNKSVGKATVERSGLYYYVKCKCFLEEPVLSRVIASTSSEMINIGVCIPSNGYLIANAKIAANRITDDRIRFDLIVQSKILDKIYPICKDEPFSKIEYLRNCTYFQENDRAWIKCCQVNE